MAPGRRVRRTSSGTNEPVGDFDRDLELFAAYVADVEIGSYHPKWVRANPVEAASWAVYRDAVRAGKQASVPDLRSSYGRALVHAGEMGMSITRIVGTMTPPPPPPPPPPPSGDAWDEMLAQEFPITSFTPLRTVNVTSASALNAACADLRAGDRINASNFTYNGSFQGVRDKNLSGFAEIHYTNVNFVATGTQYGYALINTSKVRSFGADITGGGYAIPIFQCEDVEFRGTVHDIGGTAVHPTGNGVRANRITVVVEAWNCGLNHTLDPHADKGTGLHALYAGDSGGVPNIDCKYAVDTHDQSNCAGGVQLTNQQNGFIAVRARDLSFFSTTQTAGNAIQHFGSNLLNCGLWVDAARISGHGFRSQGGTLSSSTVEYGRAVDFCLNSREGTKAWDTVGGITYGPDVEPDSFGPHLA
jgi:hypothetical protein